MREFKDSGLSHRELAQKIGVHPMTVVRWIRASSVEATYLRKSFDMLAGVVRDLHSLDPLSGHLFVFTNSRRDRIKILF